MPDCCDRVRLLQVLQDVDLDRVNVEEECGSSGTGKDHGLNCRLSQGQISDEASDTSSQLV